MPHHNAVLTALVLALSVGLTLAALLWGAGPLTVDEAYNGVDALRVRGAGTVWFFAANNGREPLYVWLAALTTAVFGPSAFALRLPAAIAGVLRVLVAYGLTRTILAEEGEDMSRNVALVTAFTAAVSLWGLTLSRLALRVGLLPLLVSISVWWLWWALRDGVRQMAPAADEPSAAHPALRDRVRRPHLAATEATARRKGLRLAAFLGSGVAAGLTVYTYLAWRILPVLVLVVVAHLAWRRRAWLQRGWWGLVAFALAAAVTAAPMWTYYRSHATALNLRVGQVSAIGGDRSWQESLALIAANVWRTGGMFLVRGDSYELYNVPARPVFPLAVAPFFVLGALVVVMRWRSPAYGVWLWWIALFALPGILADRTPHFARQVGVMPAVFVLPSLGLWAVWSRLRDREVASRARARAGTRAWARSRALSARIVAAVFVLGAVVPTVGDVRATGPVARGTPSDLLQGDSLPADARVSVAASEQVVATTSYLSNRDVRLKASHGFQSVVVPQSASPATAFLLEEDWYTDRAEHGLRQLFDLTPWGDAFVPAGYRYFRIDGIVAGPGTYRPTPYVRTDLGARLDAYDLPERAAPGGVVMLSLLWSVEEPPVDDPSDDFTWFVHLIDDGHRVAAQMDWLGYPTHAWRAGDRVLSWYDLPLPNDQPCGPLHVEVGMYSRASGTRVGLVWSPPGNAEDRSGAGLQRSDRAIFGAVEVACDG